MSFLDLAWVRLGIDPIHEGVRVVDGHRFAVEAAAQRGPLLVAQCDTAAVLSDVKLAVGEADEHATVTVLARLGLPDERIETLPWPELDRAVIPDHLTSVWIPALGAPIGAAVESFVELVATLRRECPWDREQTHASLRRHLLEEAYEVVDAIDGVDPENGAGYEHLEEELGDLLFQIVFHSTLATEAGQFGLDDVAQGIHDKLYARHPHVFGTADQLAARGPAGGRDAGGGGGELGTAEESREGSGQCVRRHTERPAGARLRVEGAEEGGNARRARRGRAVPGLLGPGRDQS